MIWSAIATAWTVFARLPRGWHIALGVLVLCLLALTLHRCAVSDAVEADRSASAAKAVTTARKADEAAHGAVEAKSDTIEQENRDAQDAARNSDDALAAGLRSLRGQRAP